MHRVEINDKYRCPDVRCAAEVLVLRASARRSAPRTLVCTCGSTLVPGWARPVYLRTAGAFAPRLR
jgi:hypothetical protein